MAKVIKNNKLAISRKWSWCEFDFLHVFRHTLLYLYDLVHSYEFSQVHQGMPKIILSTKYTICQDWIEVLCLFLHIAYTFVEINELIQLFQADWPINDQRSAMQIFWLVSISWGTLLVNVLKV